MTILAPAHLITALQLPTGAHPLPDSSVDGHFPVDETVDSESRWTQEWAVTVPEGLQ